MLKSKQIQISIIGIILDSPYTTLSHFVEDNANLFIPYLPRFFVSYIFKYLVRWFKQKINVDIEQY